MFCNQCGKSIPDGAGFCPECGANLSAFQPPVAPQPAAPQGISLEKPVEPAAPQAPVVEQPVAPQPVPQAPVSEQPAAPQPAPQAPVFGQPVAPQPAPQAPVYPQPTAPQAPAYQPPVTTQAPVYQPPVAPQPATTSNPAPGKKMDKKTLTIIAAAAGGVVALLLLIIIIANVAKSGGKNDKYGKTYVTTFYGNGNDYIVNSKGEKLELDEDLYDYEFSADGSVIAYTVYDGSEILYVTGTDLKPVMVADGVESFNISYDGSTIVYVADYSSNGGDMYLYNIKKGTSTKLDSEVYAYGFTISPSGSYVGYIKDYESYNDNALMICSAKGKSVKVDKDGSYPVSISDDGKTFFFLDEDEKLYLYNGKDNTKISADVDDCVVNKTCTEILYEKEGKTYYYAKGMDDALKVSGGYLYTVAEADRSIPTKYMGYAEIVGYKTFKGAVVSTDAGLYWINTNGKEAVKIASVYNYSDYRVSSNGKSIAYLSGGDVYVINKLDAHMNSKCVYDNEYADYFIASADLKNLYVAVDDELFYIKGTSGKTNKVSNDLDSKDDWGSYYYYGVVCYNDKMDKIFFIEDEVLYYAGTTDKSKVKVAEDIDYMYSTVGGVYYYLEDEGDYYYYYIEGKNAVLLFTTED